MGTGNSKEKGSKNGDKNDDVIEGVVCQESDLKENEMKAFEVGDHGKILVVRQKGQIYAVGNKCTHYGAPLHTGALGDGHVRCPWHGACFNLATGDIEDFPGLDSLPCFKVEVQKDGGVKVQGSLSMLKTGRRQKCMATFDKGDERTFVVVGGGPAAQVCAETLRQDGFKGTLIMLSKEQVIPYDRIKLSKILDASPEKLALRSADFYKDNNIELKLGTELLNLDATNKVAHLSSGEKINYDSIFLATGSRPRPLSVSGSNLKNIFVLRNVDDANAIAKEIKEDKNVVIIGASFIGMECAAYCVGKAKSVTVVGRGAAPFVPVLGSQIGGQIMKWFAEKGITFCMDTDVVEVLPNEVDSSSVGALKLANDQILSADIVVVGIGAIANTDYLKDAGVELGKGGTVPVNEFLETNVPGVFAGGDIAFAPVLGTVAAIGHWQLAHYHGRIGGRNMLGKKEPLKTVPFFWTMLFNKGIRYAGYAPDFDDVVLHGNLEELKFIAYYCKNNSVLAVATCGNDPVAAQFAELLSSGKSITKDDIQNNPTAWIK
ncbi:hypothetical protein R5R35_004720 [Gryllus longicercus]|uniref:Rieske domain-containing protein n=1 Tax=Gryllus longicercus TaxID=2509291 RepID=A0AAN9VGQ4_9ORTH